MRVIVNDRPLRQTLTGVGHYIAQLLRHIPDVEPKAEVDPFYFKYVARSDWRRRVTASDDSPGPDGSLESPPAAPAALPVTPAADHLARAARHPRDVGGARKPWWLRRIMQGAYATWFRRVAGRYDVYHEPNHIPMRCDRPTVTTVHDLSVLVHPDWHPADRVRWYEREFDAGVRRTRLFIAASEFTKREMVQRLGIAEGRIVVTYQAARPAFRPQSAEVTAQLRAQLQLPEGYFLYVGTLEPRKNVEGLLAAFAALPAVVRARHPLVLAGAWGWRQEALRARLDARRLGADVRIVGYLNDRILAGLYSGCTALVWPTFYEGFGMPPLEAMACGAAVMVSDVASLPEVVGTAGMLLDPRSPEDWAGAMNKLVEDPLELARLRSAGLERAGQFSWQRCARQTVQCFNSVRA